MKKIIFSFLFTILINSIAISQNKVESLDLMGKTYTVTSVFPEEILGEYHYEGTDSQFRFFLAYHFQFRRFRLVRQQHDPESFLGFFGQ